MPSCRSTADRRFGGSFAKQFNRKQNHVRVFEIARVFRKDSADQFVQNERIGGLWYGSVLPRAMGARKHAT